MTCGVKGVQDSGISNDTCFFLVPGLYQYACQIPAAYIISSILNALLSVTASIGNSIVVYTIYTTPRLYSPANLLLLNLALSDLGVALLVQPLSVVYKASEYKLNIKFLTYCVTGVITEVLGFIFCVFSFLIITAITIERYIAIKLHLRFPGIVTASRVKCLVLIIWALVILSAIVRLHCTTCKILIVILIALFLFNLSVIIFCYISIWRVVRRHSVQIHVQSASFKTQREKTMRILHIWKSVVTIIYVVSAYFICYAPYTVALMLTVKHGWNSFTLAAVNITYPVMFLSSTIDPVLYCWRAKEIRDAAKKIFLTREHGLAPGDTRELGHVLG